MKLYGKKLFFNQFLRKVPAFLNEILEQILLQGESGKRNCFLPICSVLGRLFKSFSICLESVESLQDLTSFPET